MRRACGETDWGSDWGLDWGLGLGSSAAAPNMPSKSLSSATSLPSDGVRQISVEAAAAPFETLQRETLLEIAAEDDLLVLGRVATFSELPEDNDFVTVKALDDAATVVTHRDLLIVLDTAVQLEVALAASCGTVQCPSPGDEASQVACRAGSCVSSSCSSQLLGACPAECESDSDCSTSVTCGVSRCIEGACLVRQDGC